MNKRKVVSKDEVFREPGERSFPQLVVYSGFWAFALQITDRLFSLLRIIVLARLLAPTDFGLFGIALLVMSTLETFSYTGFQQALIQKKNEIKSYLDSAWAVQVIRGIVLALIFFAIAPYVASFFNEPAAVLLLRTVGLAMLFQGLTNIGVVYFQKDLEFHKQFAYMVSKTLIDLGVAVSAALLLHNAWALVYGLLAGSFAQMLVSYLIHPYRPRFRLTIHKVRELSNFGLWIWGIAIVGFIALQVDKAIVGKLLGIAALGFYTVACRFADIVIMDVGRVISSVTFPTYSKIQNEAERLKKWFLTSFEMALFISLPLSIIIVTLAPQLTFIILGEKWIPIIGALQILTISGLVRSTIAPCGVLFLAIGKPNIDFWLTLIRAIVVVLLAVPLAYIWNITGVACATLLGVGITLPIWWYLSLKTIKINYSSLFRRFIPFLFGAITMIVAIMVVKTFTTINNDLLVLSLVVLIGTVLYLISLLGWWWYSSGGPIAHIFYILTLVSRRFSKFNLKEGRTYG